METINDCAERKELLFHRRMGRGGHELALTTLLGVVWRPELIFDPEFVTGYGTHVKINWGEIQWLEDLDATARHRDGGLSVGEISATVDAMDDQAFAIGTTNVREKHAYGRN